MSLKRLVVIGGGTGTFSVLQALRDAPLDLTAIVSTADDGGSTGVLRDEMGVLPPGDIRQALVALSPDSTVLRDLLNYRFQNNSLAGHSFGNLLLSALEKVTGSFDQAIIEAGHILGIKGQVIPVTRDQLYLKAQTEDGKIIQGEHAIEEHIWAERSRIRKITIEPPCKVHPLARQAILKADLIVIAPGSLFTSLVPNFLVGGVGESLLKTKAKVAYLVNLMTEKGQACEFFVQDFAELIQKYLGKRQLDYVLYNNRKPVPELLERYRQERERQLVVVDRSRLRNLPYRLIGTDLIGSEIEKRAKRAASKVSKSDALAKTRTLVRHDPKRLAKLLGALLYMQEAERYLR